MRRLAYRVAVLLLRWSRHKYPKRPRSNGEVTDYAYEMFGAGGGCLNECECGRHYFDTDALGGWTWEPGEFEELERLAEEQPKKYIGQNGVHTWYAFGHLYVDGCKCGRAADIEALIWDRRDDIARYIMRRSKALAKKEQETQAVLESG